MPIIEKGGIVHLKIILDWMFFMSYTIVKALNNWLKQFSQEGNFKTFGYNIALLMLQFMDCSVRLSDANNLPI